MHAFVNKRQNGNWRPSLAAQGAACRNQRQGARTSMPLPTSTMTSASARAPRTAPPAMPPRCQAAKCGPGLFCGQARVRHCALSAPTCTALAREQMAKGRAAAGPTIPSKVGAVRRPFRFLLLARCHYPPVCFNFEFVGQNCQEHLLARGAACWRAVAPFQRAGNSAACYVLAPSLPLSPFASCLWVGVGRTPQACTCLLHGHWACHVLGLAGLWCVLGFGKGRDRCYLAPCLSN
mgnify:CR=1 FL=1